MPSMVPRSNPSKKKEILAQREQMLLHAIHNDLPRAKQLRAAERVRTAQLGLLKAKRHWVTAAKIQNKAHEAEVANIEAQTRTWSEKPAEKILRDYGAK